MKAAERIRLMYPLDGANFDISGECSMANVAAMTPGVITVMDANGQLVPCNAGATAAHRVQPVIWVNIDVATRGDAKNGGIKRDGTRVGLVAGIQGAGLILALQVSTVFKAGSAPVVGDYVTKSLTDAGKVEALTSAELATALGGIAAQDSHGMVVGTVMKPVDAQGFVVIRTY